MSFDWAEYLSVAEALCGTAVSGPPAGIEAHQRAGVSRAYYAGYISARNRLRDVDGVVVPPGGNPHRFVADQYRSDRDLRRVQIGIELDRLRAARNRCDYDDVVAQLPRLTRRSLARAVEILANLRRL
jgi:hypothetical protein